MQFRAAILYIAIFSLIAVGAYAMHATADAPEATVDETEADHVLSDGDNFTAGDRAYTLTAIGEQEAGGGGGGAAMAGTLEYVNESGVVEAEWGSGDTVQFEENGTEYAVEIDVPEGGDASNESTDGNQSASVTLREDFDEDEFDADTYRFFDIDDEPHVGITENGTERVVHLDDFEEIDSRSYEANESVEFYHGDSERQVEATITEIGDETVTLEWRGETTTEYELEQGGTVTLTDQTYVAYFPSAEEVYLSSDVDSFQEQEQEVQTFEQRLTGLWWVLVMTVITILLLAGMAFMPVRG